jgi:hypothetical protein
MTSVLTTGLGWFQPAVVTAISSPTVAALLARLRRRWSPVLASAPPQSDAPRKARVDPDPLSAQG